jgi:hypothetical protein
VAPVPIQVDDKGADAVDALSNAAALTRPGGR